MKSKMIGDLLGREGNAPVTLSLSLGPGEEPPGDIVKRLVQRSALGSVNIVDVRPLARVVSVRGKPNALVPLVESDEIQDALYSNEPDVYPKPVKRSPVDIETDKNFRPIRSLNNLGRDGRIPPKRNK
jgi:hypothetical protein